MSDEQTRNALRGMAWERAKGELNSMLCTFYDPHYQDEQFKRLEDAIAEFVEKIEGAALQG